MLAAAMSRAPTPPRARLSAAAPAALLLASALVAGCGKPPVVARPAPHVAQLGTMTVTSPAFGEGSRIPVDYTCDGKDLMPELVLSAAPEGTKSLVLLVEDPDAPGGTFTHLVAFNLSPELHKLAGGTELGPTAGDAARFGLNDFRVAHYSGPCPPKGEVHRYRYRVVALDAELKLPEGAPRGQIEEAMDLHILGEGALTGTFGH
jgi:Raf kinase inhibitor-like YbhB/YbcL family protein